MKFILYTALAFCLFGINTDKVHAQTSKSQNDVSFTNLKINRHDSLLDISMVIDLTKLNLGSNSTLTFVPRIVNGKNELILSPITVAGRRQYIYKQRNNEKSLPIKRANNTSQTIPYAKTINFEPWMAGAHIIVSENTCGCLDKFVDGENIDIGLIKGLNFTPIFAYIQPTTQEKMQAGKVTLNFGFPVGKTMLISSFGKNQTELEKIKDLYQKIKNDKYLTLQDVTVHGYASPEGSYPLNTRLALERAKAIADYTKNYLKLTNDVITESTPEDWEGVKKYLDENTIPNKEAVLAIVQSQMNPDKKDSTIRSKYPAAYRDLLQNCYPALRRTDCSISYKIKQLSIDECKQFIKTNPKLLGLDELFRLAELYSEGSTDFDNIFLIAVKMFPDNSDANLNAANIALKKNELEKALTYLKKTNESPQSLNAYGIYYALKGEPEKAQTYFKQAAQKGLKAAELNEQSIEKNN